MLQNRPRRDLRGVIVPDIEPNEQDVAIAHRLLAAHGAAVESAPAANGGRFDVWAMIGERQGDFEGLLRRGDPEELARYLCNVSRQSASHGISQGAAEFELITRDHRYREFLVALAHDKLILLAEAVGAIAPDNPEQGVLGAGRRCDPAELVGLVSRRLGVSLELPPVDGGMLKLDTGRGLFGERDLNAIYTARLLADTLCHLKAPNVCEIGAGTGRVAYWAWRLGLGSYTIIDLPHVNVVQGYYALKTMPSDSVVLHGESEPSDGGDRLWVLPPHAIADIDKPVFDLVLNQDSMPEMAIETVEEYLVWIGRCCRGLFVSINHETKPAYGSGHLQLSVPETIERVGGFVARGRHPYWLRRGYVVELYAADEAIAAGR